MKFETLKTRVVSYLTAVPASLSTLTVMTGCPEWQVKYAVQSLLASEVLEPSGKLYKLREPKRARRV